MGNDITVAGLPQDGVTGEVMQYTVILYFAERH